MSFMKPDCSFPLSQEPRSRLHRDEKEFSPRIEFFFCNFHTKGPSTSITSKNWFISIGLYQSPMFAMCTIHLRV